MPTEEGQVPTAEEDAHGALEAPALSDGRQRLDVCTLDLPWDLADLPLTDNGAGVRTEGDAAAASGLKVDDGQADIVRIRKHLNLHVDVVCISGVEEVRAERATAVRYLVGLLNLHNLGSCEGLSEHRHLCLEASVAALPVDTDLLPQSCANPEITGRLQWVEDTITVKLQAQEGAGPQHTPRPALCAIELSQSPASSIGLAQVRCTQEGGHVDARALREVQEGRPAGPRSGLRTREPPALQAFSQEEWLLVAQSAGDKQAPKSCLEGPATRLACCRLDQPVGKGLHRVLDHDSDVLPPVQPT
mmetsp:Transcript_108172/g.288001  ORF Transcript_108172/g.288001 Transcript_108172/m.288001 type:complete len:303 (-) Transcript_108172:24-932(-)